MPDKAIIFTDDLLDTFFAKTCHGLLRGSSRFEILGVVDSKHPGRDAGEVMDGVKRGVLVHPTVDEFLSLCSEKPEYCLVGVAFPGGILPNSCREQLMQAMKHGMSIVCGLHHFLSDDPEFKKTAQENNVELIDIRKPRPTSELHFWSGEIYSVKTPRIAVLGTDCAVGKRTTCRFIMEACQEHGVKTEMIYTGQTGWMQGYKHGFILDATPNDFVSGEIERAIVECERESKPDLILIEGQSSLRNPSGPCGAEILLSGNVKGVILQHEPSREHFADLEELGCLIPPVKEEIDLIQIYGAETLALTLSEAGDDERTISALQKQLADDLSLPVVRPLREGVGALLPLITKFMEA